MNKTDRESMNQELQEWIKETKDIQLEKKNSSSSHKKPEGRCMLCGKHKAKFICLKCEKSVCMECYFKIIGVCKKCVPEDIAEKWEGKTPDWEKILGVQWVD
jgi:hypothetical protein